jgi:lambda family phage portal protein
MKATFLDKAISHISPSRGVSRLQSRAKWQAMTAGPVQRKGGQKKGTLFNWIVSKLTRFNEGQERETLTERSQDLVANTPHAVSCIESLSTNVVGTGLNPQSKPKWKRLGITEARAKEFSEQAEWVWSKWCQHADIQGRLHFQDIQYLAAYSMFMNGEWLILPTMRSDNALPGQSQVRLAFQALNPVRMATPYDMSKREDLRDGVELSGVGSPNGYWIATPKSGRLRAYLSSEDFTRYPAMIGHRPGVLHSFHAAAKEPDRVRGVSVLAPAMKAFKDLYDYLDFELVGAIVASSLSVFVEQSNPADYTAGFQTTDNNQAGDEVKYQEIEPGQVLYGNAGEKPHLLKNERPSNTFDGFVETLIRAVGTSVGLPYEVVAKDFSKTNYSSARAALLEAWRVYMLHRKWLERHLCQPVWRMVTEEAWLRGELQLPAGGPGFYEAMAEYTEATWIGPAKGHVDPVKEMQANIKGLENNIFTLADLAAEQGKDWEGQVEQRGREQEKVSSTMPQTEEGTNAVS